MTTTPRCTVCGEAYSERRAALGYTICMDCGDAEAFKARKTWTVAPAGPKQAYTRITRKEELKWLNPKTR